MLTVAWWRSGPFTRHSIHPSHPLKLLLLLLLCKNVSPLGGNSPVWFSVFRLCSPAPRVAHHQSVSNAKSTQNLATRTDRSFQRHFLIHMTAVARAKNAKFSIFLVTLNAFIFIFMSMRLLTLFSTSASTSWPRHNPKYHLANYINFTEENRCATASSHVNTANLHCRIHTLAILTYT